MSLPIVSQLLLREPITGFIGVMTEKGPPVREGNSRAGLRGLSPHALQIWQTPDTSWPLRGWTLDLKCTATGAQTLSALSGSNPLQTHRECMPTLRNTGKHLHSAAYLELTHTELNQNNPPPWSIPRVHVRTTPWATPPYGWGATTLDKPGVE